MYVWALGLSCETPAGLHMTRASTLQTPQKFHEKTPRETEKKAKMGAGEDKKKAKCSLPHPLGPPPFGATLFGAPPFGAQYWVWASPPRPDLARFFLGLAPFGPHHDTHTQIPKWIGQKMDWPKKVLAKIWPWPKRDWPKSVPSFTTPVGSGSFSPGNRNWS